MHTRPDHTKATTQATGRLRNASSAIIVALACAASAPALTPFGSLACVQSSVAIAAFGQSPQLYKRILLIDRVSFRRDGDPFGGRGEVKMSWTTDTVNYAGQYTQTGKSSEAFKLPHARGKKKCTYGSVCETTYDSDCRWALIGQPIWDDWFIDDSYCNPISLSVSFSEFDEFNERSIGSYASTGTTSYPHLNSPVPTGTLQTDCTRVTLDNTLGSKPARMEYLWQIYPQGKGALKGRSGCEATDCGTIDQFQFGQESGPILRFRITLQSASTVDLTSTSFVGTRQMYVPLNIDLNQLTGDQAPGMCGADYRVGFDLTYAGAGTPPSLNAYIEFYNIFGTWQLVPAQPFDIILAPQVLDFRLAIADIGAPALGVSCWATFDQNGFVSGTMPCTNPCTNPLGIQFTADTQCPYVEYIDDSDLTANGGAGTLRIRFSEPMAPISASDLTVTPPLPSGTTLALSLTDVSRLLSVTASPAWPPGTFSLALAPSITDVAGNPLSGSPQCGTPLSPIPFCTEDGSMMIADSSGNAVTSLPFGIAAHLSGSGFPSGGSAKAYLVQVDSLDRAGAPLVDWTDSGPDQLSFAANGSLANASLGTPVTIDEYAVVIDIDGNGLLSAPDRVASQCGVGLVVMPECEDGPGPPFALWSMDQKTGTLVGERGYGLHGSFTGGATWTSGRVNGALSFNGSNAVVSVPVNADLWIDDADFSVSAWIRTSASAGTIVSHMTSAGGYTLRLANGKPQFLFSDGGAGTTFTASASPNLADGQWHLVTVTVERLLSAGLTIYVDGSAVLVGNPMSESGTIQPNTALLIGANNGGDYFNGAIDEVRLDDEALDVAEVGDLLQQSWDGGCFRKVCLGDFTGDGIVDGADLGQILAGWGTPGGDINGDGLTNFFDLGILLGAWGQCQ